MKLSVIIPSYKDPLLNRTVIDILTASNEEIEVICVLDGYWQVPVDDKRVRVIHLGKNRGMRGAINAGIFVAGGEFIMRADEHCMFAKGFDTELTSSCQDDWIMTAERYFLDPIKWEKMDIEPVRHEKLVIQGGTKFAGQRWKERDEKQKDVMVSETMAMQGSMWLMPKKWWDKVIGELQTEGYGPHYQDSHEMVFKTWKAGGKLMLNKNTWFAHKHRSFSRTHNDGTIENPANKEVGWKYSLDAWKDYYEHEVRPKWGI